jgi:hypothetical protein
MDIVNLLLRRQRRTPTVDAFEGTRMPVEPLVRWSNYTRTPDERKGRLLLPASRYVTGIARLATAREAAFVTMGTMRISPCLRSA